MIPTQMISEVKQKTVEFHFSPENNYGLLLKRDLIITNDSQVFLSLVWETAFSLSFSTRYSWEQVCFKVSIFNFFSRLIKARHITN